MNGGQNLDDIFLRNQIPQPNTNLKELKPDGTKVFHDDTSGIANIIKALGGGAEKVGGAVKSAAKGFNEAAQDPGKRAGMSRLLGTIGTAFSATHPQSWQNQLGQAAISSASGVQQDILRKGKKLEGIAGFGVSSQERSALVQEALAEREIGARETSAKAYDKIANAQLFQAQTGRDLGEERMQLENELMGLRGREFDQRIAEFNAKYRGKAQAVIEGDDLVFITYDPATDKMREVSRGPRPYNELYGGSGSGDQYSEFKAVNLEERDQQLDKYGDEAGTFLDSMGLERDRTLWPDTDYGRDQFINHGRERSNPNKPGSRKYLLFETARPYMDLMMSYYDLADKTSITDAEKADHLRKINTVERVRGVQQILKSFSDKDLKAYNEGIRRGYDPVEAANKIIEDNNAAKK